METMNNIELKDGSVYPDEIVLRSVLGESYKAYCKLIEFYDENDMDHTWRYYNDGKAWLCKVHKKKRTIVWMSAWKGFIKATIYFPEKYIDDIYELNISGNMIEKIKRTKNVGRSKPCIFEIMDESVMDDFKKVMQLKIMRK